MHIYGLNLAAFIAAMFSLTACASCSTVSDSPVEDKTGAFEPSNGSNTEGGSQDDSKNDSINTDNMNYAEFPLAKGENGKAPSIRLNSGFYMPIVGLGTYSLTGDVCINSVKAAIESKDYRASSHD